MNPIGFPVAIRPGLRPAGFIRPIGPIAGIRPAGQSCGVPALPAGQTVAPSSMSPLMAGGIGLILGFVVAKIL